MKIITKFFKNNYIKIIIIVVVVIFVSIFNFFQKINVENIKYVKISKQVVKVELALTPDIQQKGLSGRNSLKEDEGMLFIFKKPSKNYFWMKDMNFPIDIIWIDENFKIIYIKKGALPSSFPDSFGPGVDNRYVLEVSDGFSEKNNLKLGDRVEFLR